jgi:hypothetical protein
MGAMLGTLLVLASTASAESFPISDDGSPASLRSTVEFELRTKSGYRVQVEGSGHEATLAVSRKSIGAVYAVRTAKVSTDGLRARFGKLGRISVRFEPSGKVDREEPPRRCKGKERVVRFGRYVGTIRFRGELGYVRVVAGEARGTSVSAPPWRCKPRHHGGKFAARSSKKAPPDIEFTVLEATARNNRLGFVATEVQAPKEQPLTIFNAGTLSRRGGMVLYHYALVLGKDRTFSFDDALSTATVDPPKPFRGSAAFQRNPDGSTAWSGTLRVFLPGVGDLALAGPQYKAKLSQPPLLGRAGRIGSAISRAREGR